MSALTPKADVGKVVYVCRLLTQSGRSLDSVARMAGMRKARVFSTVRIGVGSCNQRTSKRVATYAKALDGGATPEDALKAVVDLLIEETVAGV